LSDFEAYEAKSKATRERRKSDAEIHLGRDDRDLPDHGRGTGASAEVSSHEQATQVSTNSRPASKRVHFSHESIQVDEKIAEQKKIHPAEKPKNKRAKAAAEAAELVEAAARLERSSEVLQGAVRGNATRVGVKMLHSHDHQYIPDPGEEATK